MRGPTCGSSISASTCDRSGSAFSVGMFLAGVSWLWPVGPVFGLVNDGVGVVPLYYLTQRFGA